MGFHVSWIAIRGITPDVVHSRLNLQPTGEREYYPESDVTGVMLPSGWYLVFFRDTCPPELEDSDDLYDLSLDAEMLLFVVEDGAMMSMARGYGDGSLGWIVMNDMDGGPQDMEIYGYPPSCYETIRDSLLKESTADDPRSFYGIPAEMSKQLIGFRHDESIEGLDGEVFEVLERI